MKTDLAVNGETVPKQNEKKNPKDTQKTLNKPSSLASGVHISQEPQLNPHAMTPRRSAERTPTTQETANNAFC